MGVLPPLSGPQSPFFFLCLHLCCPTVVIKTECALAGVVWKQCRRWQNLLAATPSSATTGVSEVAAKWQHWRKCGGVAALALISWVLLKVSQHLSAALVCGAWESVEIKTVGRRKTLNRCGKRKTRDNPRAMPPQTNCKKDRRRSHPMRLLVCVCFICILVDCIYLCNFTDFTFQNQNRRLLRTLANIVGVKELQCVFP